MTFFTCFDPQGSVIARCQTEEEIEVLRQMGRPIAEVRELKEEEAVVCSLTGSPSEFDEDLSRCGINSSNNKGLQEKIP